MIGSDCRERQRRLRRKCIKNVLLSLMLVVVLLATTGCAFLLIGDNKKAYDLMVEAADYFKYPSSVRIESGEIVGDGMYCVIGGKNSYGSYRTDTYYVTSYGYPKDDYDRRCYSDKLNVDLINNALAAHFGGSSGSTSANLMGGINMSSGGVVAIYIIVLIVVLCLNGYLASNASDIANDKGYDKRKWFHMCFWLGPLAYIIVAAMPDLTLRKQQAQTVELLQKLVEKQDNAGKPSGSATAEARQQADDVSSFLPRI